MVDFNLAYNMPCVFSPFATCPLPPAGNRLTIRVPAGKKAAAIGCVIPPVGVGLDCTANEDRCDAVPSGLPPIS